MDALAAEPYHDSHRCIAYVANIMTVFSTSQIRMNDRCDFWHDLVDRTYSKSDCSVLDRRSFDANIDIFTYGEIELTRLKSGAVAYNRTPAHIRRDSHDHLLVHLLCSGEGRLAQNDRVFRHLPDSVVIYDTSRPYSFTYEDGYGSIVLRLPRQILQSRLIDVDGIGGRHVPPDRPETRLVTSVMREFANLADDGRLSHPMLCSALDLLVRALNEGGTEHHEAQDPRAALPRIKAFMRSHLTDETFLIADICREQNISVRSLNRAFAREGTTPTAWLRDHRLALAYSMISERKAATISEVAFAVGFSDLTHFGRSFRRRYGKTPSQFLATH